MTQLLAHLHRGKTSGVRTLLKWVDMAWHELMAGRWSQINSNRKHSTIFMTFFFFLWLTTETNYWGQQGQQPGPQPGSVFSTRVITEISAHMRHAVQSSTWKTGWDVQMCNKSMGVGVNGSHWASSDTKAWLYKLQSMFSKSFGLNFSAQEMNQCQYQQKFFRSCLYRSLITTR